MLTDHIELTRTVPVHLTAVPAISFSGFCWNWSLIPRVRCDNIWGGVREWTDIRIFYITRWIKDLCQQILRAGECWSSAEMNHHGFGGAAEVITHARVTADNWGLGLRWMVGEGRSGLEGRGESFLAVSHREPRGGEDDGGSRSDGGRSEDGECDCVSCVWTSTLPPFY